jgi:hypothetical protein
VIVTLATHSYLPKIVRYLDTLAEHKGEALAYLGCVACEAPDSPVPTFRIPPGMLARSLGNPGNGCIQHGNWLPYLPVQDDEAVIICTDGDVKLQRTFTSAEWRWLQSWKHGQVGIGPNEPKEGGDSMQNELVRISPLLSHEEIWQRFYPQATTPPPIGNAGCVVATRKTWVELWMHYLRRWLDTAPVFGHIAVQQWTLNLAINEGFQRVVLPQSFHTHGHWGYPGQPFDGWGYEGTAIYEGEPILFAHKTW